MNKLLGNYCRALSSSLQNCSAAAKYYMKVRLYRAARLLAPWIRAQSDLGKWDQPSELRWQPLVDAILTAF